MPGDLRDFSELEWTHLTETQKELVRAKKGDKEYKGVGGVPPPNMFGTCCAKPVTHHHHPPP